jgi:hypothetical protein
MNADSPFPGRVCLLVRWIVSRSVQALVRLILRSPLHTWLSAVLLLLTDRGRKSGREYTLPVQYAQDGNKLYLVPGTTQQKTWWRNSQGGGFDQHGTREIEPLRFC